MELFNGIVLPNGTKCKFRQAVSKKVVVADITIRNHPAYNRGRSKQLNARAPIKKGEFIGYYAGEIHYHPEDEDEISYWGAYQLDPSPDCVYYVDAETIGNELRYMNDPRGLGNIQPNVKFFTAWRKFKGFDIVEVQAIRDIKAGEEILISYGPGYWKAIQKWYEKKTPHVCEHCDYRSDTTIKLANHSRIHNENRPVFGCTICGKEYLSKYPLDDHINKEHSKEIVYSCDKCDYTTLTASAFYFHGREVHNTKEFKCFECDDIFADKLKLNFHVKKVHDSKGLPTCEICNISYAKRSRLNRHNANLHTPKTLRCRKCKHVAKSLYELRQHTADKHARPKPYQCEYCSKSYQYPSSLYKHTNDYHTKTREYSCDLCDYSSFSLDCYRSHLRHMHSDV